MLVIKNRQDVLKSLSREQKKSIFQIWDCQFRYLLDKQTNYNFF